jgi:non-heme chloroperoxidase
VLDLKNAILVGHSTGGGEVVRYIARHGSERVDRIVLISAVPPLMARTVTNPDGLPIETFDDIRAGVVGDRSQYFRDFALPFYGFNRKGAKVSEGIIEAFWRQAVMASIKGVYDCIKAFSETDFREDLKKIDVPTLIVQGDDDQIVPFAISGKKTVTLVKGAVLKVYPGAPHGLPATMHEELCNDLLAFFRAGAAYATTGAPPPPT